MLVELTCGPTGIVRITPVVLSCSPPIPKMSQLVPAMSSFAATSSGTSSLGFASLPHSVFESAIAPLLSSADLLAFSSVSRAARQLVLSPALWRSKVFTSFPPLPSPISTSSPPSWCDVVQVVHAHVTDYRKWRGSDVPAVKLRVQSLIHFRNLRHVHTSATSLQLMDTSGCGSWLSRAADMASWARSSLSFVRFPSCRCLYSMWFADPRHTHSASDGSDSDEESEPVLSRAVTSLASLRHLTRISLHRELPQRTGSREFLDNWALKLLATLPVLASFEAD